MSLWMTITKIGRKEDLEEESYFRKLSLCYRFPPDVTSCFAEVTLKRKMPVTGYIPEGDIVICCVNLLAGFVSFRKRKEGNQLTREQGAAQCFYAAWNLVPLSTRPLVNFPS